MSLFRECVKKHFDFLTRFGYIMSNDNNADIIKFIGKNNQLDVFFSKISYELTCQFIDGDKTFSLQDGLEFGMIADYKGLYQVADKKEIEIGISYLAEAVKKLFERVDVSNPRNFQKIYQYRIDMHTKLLNQYYLETDLKKAEECWKRKDYAKAKEIFEKNIDYLSDSQRKKLDIINRKI